MRSSRTVGALGEQYASAVLEAEGYRIRARNFRSRFGEIDIIAVSETEVVFVEVKTRTRRSATAPAEAVDRGKQHRICLTAEYYLAGQGRRDARLQPRFDCIEVYTDGEGCPIRFQHLKNIF